MLHMDVYCPCFSSGRVCQVAKDTSTFTPALLTKLVCGTLPSEVTQSPLHPDGPPPSFCFCFFFLSDAAFLSLGNDALCIGWVDSHREKGS